MNHPIAALYPWCTIDGSECSAHYPSGSAAYHINADIAFGIGLYLDAADDVQFLLDAGAEILFETARIWPQLGYFNSRKGGRSVFMKPPVPMNTPPLPIITSIPIA